MTERQPQPQAVTWGLQAPTGSPAGDFCGEGAGRSGACLGHPGLCSVSGSPPRSPGAPGAGKEVGAVDFRRREPGSLTHTRGPGHGQPLGPAWGRVPTCPDRSSWSPHGGAQRTSTGPTGRSRGRLEGPLSSRSKRCFSPIQPTCPAGSGQVCEIPDCRPLPRPGLPIRRRFDSASREVREEVKPRAPVERSQTSSAKPAGILRSFVKEEL